ncbi:hypothetical protein JQX13_38685 [Archangium violaceum]|uniref:hypothetical protein n=1 Tax=Archangium violaceum TaxID=83451 RepID=UPI00193C0C8B|nr:hypothetical protein [Archangium violaceum]QRK06013.1 hypothetical protein JQX13_38685 [Archangium violaceum]
MTPSPPSLPSPGAKPARRERAVLELPRFVSPRGFTLLWCVLGLVLAVGALAVGYLADGVLALQEEEGVADERR